MKTVKLMVVNTVMDSNGMVEHFAFDEEGNQYQWRFAQGKHGAWRRYDCIGVLNSAGALLPGESVEVNAPLSDPHVARIIAEAKSEG